MGAKSSSRARRSPVKPFAFTSNDGSDYRGGKREPQSPVQSSSVSERVPFALASDSGRLHRTRVTHAGLEAIGRGDVDRVSLRSSCGAAISSLAAADGEGIDRTRA